MQLSITIPDIDDAAFSTLMEKFSKRVGDELVHDIQMLLGTDEIYTLSPEYAAEKPHMAGFVRYKGGDQPLIFSGEMFEGVQWSRDGNVVTIGVSDESGISDDGEDYAEKWEIKTHFLEKAYERYLGDEGVLQILEECLLEVFIDA
jgi:hypothetical protein